jgi:hypothetical protein
MIWYRVFGANDLQPEPADLLQHLADGGATVPGHFGGDEHGWFRADFPYAEGVPPLHVERYLAKEDAIRDELNAWAAWLETVEDDPVAARLMVHMVTTQQLFTLRCPRDAHDEGPVRELCCKICQFLARKTQGVYQVDRLGFFAPDGKRILDEE